MGKPEKTKKDENFEKEKTTGSFPKTSGFFAGFFVTTGEQIYAEIPDAPNNVKANLPTSIFVAFHF